jgi:hypothetical protein
MRFQNILRLTIGILGVLGLTTFAFAGPPLICHPIEIGQAKTLPWVDLNYHKGNGGYDLKGLTRDTLAILDSDAPALVHMETLRRATIYARQDPQVAKELITRLQARAAGSQADNAAAFAAFDFGYLIEAYKQWMGKDEPNPARGLDGYAWVRKAIAARGSDAEMELGAALITLSGPEAEHREHVEKAMAGAKSDPLLAQDLRSTFLSQTIASLLKQPTTASSTK